MIKNSGFTKFICVELKYLESFGRDPLLKRNSQIAVELPLKYKTGVRFGSTMLVSFDLVWLNAGMLLAHHVAWGPHTIGSALTGDIRHVQRHSGLFGRSFGMGGKFDGKLVRFKGPKRVVFRYWLVVSNIFIFTP